MSHAIRLLSLSLLVLLGGLWALAWFGRAPGESPGEAFLRRFAGLFGAEMPVPSAGGVQLPQGTTLGGPFSLTDHARRAGRLHRALPPPHGRPDRHAGAGRGGGAALPRLFRARPLVRCDGVSH